MIRPHPPRLRMKRRKTVSVTPAMGAKTVAGEIVTVPICKSFGTGLRDTGSRAGAPAPLPAELSQNLRMLPQKVFTTGCTGEHRENLHPLYATGSKESPRFGRGLD